MSVIFHPERVRQLQQELEEVASAANLLRQQIHGKANCWSYDLPIWGALQQAQQTMTRLTDEAEQLAEVVRKANQGVEQVQQENQRSMTAWWDQTSQLQSLLARFGTQATVRSVPAPEVMRAMVNRLIVRVEHLPFIDRFEQEPVVQQLRAKLASVNLFPHEAIEVTAELEAIYEQRALIAKAQRAYDMYKRYNNTAQMLAMQQLAEDSRLRLIAMGIREQAIAANMDMRSYYTGTAVQAGKFDPLYTKPIPIMASEKYRMLLMLGMNEGSGGTWARQQLQEIVFHREQLTTSVFSVMQQLREGKLPKQELSTLSTSVLQLSQYQLQPPQKVSTEEKEPPFYKQIWKSLKEIGNDAVAASNDRWDRQFDSVYDFLNYWSGGISGAIYEGASERPSKMNDFVYDFSNWLLIGIPGTIKDMGDSITGTILPEEAWSKEHVSDMLGVLSIGLGGGLGANIGKKGILQSVKESTGDRNKGNFTQDSDIDALRDRIKASVEASEAIREASKFSEYLKKEQELIESLKNRENIAFDPIKGMGEGIPEINPKYATAIDNKVKIKEQVELPTWLKETYTDGQYRTVITNENITVYRTFGGNAAEDGAFATTVPASNRISSKIDSALLPEWKNSRQYEAVIEIPKGVELNIGKVEQQMTQTGTIFKGGGDQVLLPQNWPKEWIKEIREVPSR